MLTLPSSASRSSSSRSSGRHDLSSIIPSTTAPSLFPAKNIPRDATRSGSCVSSDVSAACFTLSVVSYTNARRSLLANCSAQDWYTNVPDAGVFAAYSKFCSQYPFGSSRDTDRGGRERRRVGQPAKSSGLIATWPSDANTRRYRSESPATPPLPARKNTAGFASPWTLTASSNAAIAWNASIPSPNSGSGSDSPVSPVVVVVVVVVAPTFAASLRSSAPSSRARPIHSVFFPLLSAPPPPPDSFAVSSTSTSSSTRIGGGGGGLGACSGTDAAGFLVGGGVPGGDARIASGGGDVSAASPETFGTRPGIARTYASGRHITMNSWTLSCAGRG